MHEQYEALMDVARDVANACRKSKDIGLHSVNAIHDLPRELLEFAAEAHGVEVRYTSTDKGEPFAYAHLSTPHVTLYS